MENDRPRVYSVDEIVPGVYGWMDCPNWGFTTICEVKEIEKSENETTVFCGYWIPIQSLNEYGKSDGWRLWNKKPTMHERQMWPWHGEPSKGIKYCFEDFGWTYYDDEEE